MASALNTLMAEVGETAYVTKVSSGKSHVFKLKKSSSATFPRTVSGLLTGRIKTTGAAVLAVPGKRKLSTTVVSYFIDKSGNYYIQNPETKINKVAYIYKSTNSSLENITYSQMDGHDSKTTFTFTSSYPLQYVKFDKEESDLISYGDYIEKTNRTKDIQEGSSEDVVNYTYWDQYEYNSAKDEFVSSGKSFLFPTSTGPVKVPRSNSDPDLVYKPSYSVRLDADEGYGDYDTDKYFYYGVQDENNELYRIYEEGAEIFESESYIVTDSPTKKYEINTVLGRKFSDAINAINTPYSSESEITSQSSRAIRGRMYSEMLDIDIHTNPEFVVDSGVKKPLFKIESITERALYTGDYEYTITVIPIVDFSAKGKRYCGQIIINSRVRNILSDSRFVSKDLTDTYPKVLPLYKDGKQLVNVTRPMNGISWDDNKIVRNTKQKGLSADSSKFEYEAVILPNVQKEIDTLVPAAELRVNIYQQENNYVQLYGDRTSELYDGEIRRFSALYEPGEEYPYKIDEHGVVTETIKLGSDTIKLRCTDTGWSGRDTALSYIAEIKDVDTLTHNIPAQNGDIVKVITTSDRKIYYYLWNGSAWINTVNTDKLGGYDRDKINNPEDHAIGFLEVKTSTSIQTALNRLNKLLSGDIYKVTPHEYSSELSLYYEFRPSDAVNKIQVQLSNYDPSTANRSGQPYALLYYNSIFSSYYPSRVNSSNIQSGKIISKYKNGGTRDNLVNFTFDLGRWNTSSGISTVDELDYFVKGNEMETDSTGTYYINLFSFDTVDNKVRTDSYDPDNNIYYVRWYKMEQSNGTYKKLDFYRLLLPQKIDTELGVEIDGKLVSLIKKSDRTEDYFVNGITIDYPLPQNYYYTEMADSDTSVNYFTDMRGKLLVKYDETKARLYGTSANALKYWWKTLVSRLYQESISFIQPGINKGLVCASQSNSPRLYLGGSSKNTFYEQVSGTSTFIDIMAGVFDLTSGGEDSNSVDLGDKFHREGTEEMPSLSVADREEWFERSYVDAERTQERIETVNGIRYSVWDKYEINFQGQVSKYPDYSILINKKYDNLVKIDDREVKYLSLLSISNPSTLLRTLYPDYTLTIDQDGDTVEGYFDFSRKGEPLVDYWVDENNPKIE